MFSEKFRVSQLPPLPLKSLSVKLVGKILTLRTFYALPLTYWLIIPTHFSCWYNRNAN